MISSATSFYRWLTRSARPPAWGRKHRARLEQRDPNRCDHSMSRPVASRRFQRSIAASARRGRLLSLAAPALMSSPRVRTPIRDHPLPLPAVFRPPPPSRGVRAGWRRDLRCSGPPRDRQRGDAVRVRSPGAGRHDLRGLPLADRKKRLARLLGKRRLGIVLSEHTDEDGVLIFRQACNIGLEGIVSKRLSAPYRSGPSREWIKVKNPDSPAMIRAREADW
jgi:hypothetical protein